MNCIRGLRRPLALAAAGTVLVSGLAACSGNSGSDAGNDAPAVEQSDAGGDGSASGQSDAGGDTSDAGEDGSAAGPDLDLRTESLPVEAAEAVSTAESTAGEGTLHAVELDYDEEAGAWQWDVKILVDGTDHKVVVDAATGEVVEDDQESTDDQEEAIDLEDPMTYEEASEIATGEVDGPIRAWKLEHDDGMIQYEFDIGAVDDTTEVTVNAETGEATVD